MTQKLREAIYANLNAAHHNSPALFRSTVVSYFANWQRADPHEILLDMLECTDLATQFPALTCDEAESYIRLWQGTL